MKGKRKILGNIVLFFLVVSFLNLFVNLKIISAVTEIGGTISSDTTWTAADSPYIVTSDLKVYNLLGDITLTIEAGVIVKFDYNKKITIAGETLNAVGASGANIVFTSLADDSYGGDTNDDDPEISTAPGDWEGIIFDGGRGVLENCVIKYGGGNNTGNIYCLNGASPSIKNSEISNSSNYAIFLNNAYPTYQSNTFSDNKYDAVGLSGTDISLSGTLRNPGYPYVITSDVKVFSLFDDITLTIEAGVILKFDYDKKLTIAGEILNAVGTSDANIVFTSLADDSYGGDTNDDDPEISTAPGDWEGIIFDGGRGVLENCVIKYGGGNNAGNIYCLSGGEPRIQYCCISESKSAGIYIKGDSNPHLGDENEVYSEGCNDFYNNDTYAVYNSSPNDIKAENNWWGTTVEPTIQSEIYGEVDYDPWRDLPCVCQDITTTTTTTPSSCLAKEIYGEHSQETELLRYIRDNILSQSPGGQEIIRLYYEWSPVIVEVINEDEEFKAQVKEMVDGLLPLIK